MKAIVQDRRIRVVVLEIPLLDAQRLLDECNTFMCASAPTLAELCRQVEYAVIEEDESAAKEAEDVPF